MEKVIYNLVFNRKKRLNAEGKALIQVEAYLNRQKKYFSTKIYVKPTQWDSKRKAVRNHPNMDELNQYIEDYITYLERIELDMVQSGRPFLPLISFVVLNIFFLSKSTTGIRLPSI